LARNRKRIGNLAAAILLLIATGCTNGTQDAGKSPSSTEDPCFVDPDVVDNGDSISFDPIEVNEDRWMFPMPVQAGAMTCHDVIVTAYTVAAEDVILWVWRSSDQADEIILVYEEVLAPGSGYLKKEVNGLAPKTDYQYAFFLSGGSSFTARSVVGTFRTALPADCAEPVTIGGTHGTNRRHQPFTALEITARYDLDAFIQLGDYSYNDGADTIDAFRAKWASTLDDPGYWAILPAAGQYIVWDDHEFRNNDEYYRDMETADFQAAKDAFYERHPVPRHSNDSHWTSYRWGNTVEFFVLDCRSERVHVIPELQLGGLLYISVEQMEWLKQALLNSPCHFKVLINSVPLSNFPGFWDFTAYDRWEGFTAQHAELLAFTVDKGIDNVWSVSGDFHVGSMGSVTAAPPWNAVREVLMGPGGNRNEAMWFLYNSLGFEEQIAPPEQFDFLYGMETATLMTFDPANGSVRVVFIDAQTEEVLFDREYY